MGKQNTIKNVPFPYGRIRTWLNLKKTICITGYGLSSEADAGHYYDIQKGVWSTLTDSSTINPFSSSQSYSIVMNWFNWRRRFISIRKPSKPFVALQELQREFSLRAVNQSVDGLASANGVNDVYELYGNVLHVRCQQGHAFPDWPSTQNGNASAKCPICASNLYPDVQMFDWNSKEVVLNTVIDQIKHAKLLIKIGADNDMAPFNWPNQHDFADLPVIEIMESGWLLTVGNTSFKASVADIELEIQRLEDGGQKSYGARNYETAIRNFMIVCQTQGQSSDQ